jgi:hypothetical protein
MHPTRPRLLALLGVVVGALALVSVVGVSADPIVPRSAAHALARQQQPTVDWAAVAQALGKSGTLMAGNVYRVGLPRTDLAVTVEGTPVKAGFALGSYAAFTPLDDGSVMVMGDLVLLDEEVPTVMSGLFSGGLEVMALHNHLNQVTPHVMYLHYEGHGEAVSLATALHQALAVSGTPFGDSPPATPDSMGLDTTQLDAILGHQGTLNGSVYQVSVARAETITEMGTELVPAMGVATALNFQLMDQGQAAITGDFVLTAGEVNPVAQALRSNGIEVTALHNHALGDEPRLFYLHFWATGDALTLAQGLRAALDLTNSRP